MSSMARVLISEPHPDVRRLFEHMVARLGHDPVGVTTAEPGVLAEADLLLVETAEPEGAELARLAHELRPKLPIVCASIAPPAPELRLIPTAWLLKPFTLGRLREVLDGALARERASSGYAAGSSD